MGADHLFVYGSLRSDAPLVRGNAEAEAAKAALARSARSLGRATMQGRLYNVDWYPGMIAGGEPGERVIGEVFEVADWPALAPVLDAYEEACLIGDADQSRFEYVRDRRMARLADGQTIETWVYLYNRGARGLARIDSGDYLDAGVEQGEPA